MLIAYWIVAALLAVMIVGAGLLKVVRTKEQLTSMGLAWVEDFAGWQVKTIGAFEVLGALGLVVPMATGILPVLGPVAGIGIAIIQAGAFVTHARRKDPRVMLMANMVLFALAGAAAVLGFFALAGY